MIGIPTVSELYFGLFSPFHCSPLPLTFLSPLPSHLMVCDVTDAQSFSFPFPFPPSSVEYFHCYKHVLHLSLYMTMLAFVCMFTFWIYLPHMRENMRPFSF
jgi:hypothetical protein